MERDFLGLLTVKEENIDATVDSGEEWHQALFSTLPPRVGHSALGLLNLVPEHYVNDKIQALGRDSGMQWSFSNNISGPSQYLSFRASQEDRLRKNVHDQLDSSQKSNANGSQKVMGIDKSAGTHYPISAYALQHTSAHSISQSHETRMFPSASKPNQSITVTMNPPVVHSHVSPISISPQPHGRVPLLSPLLVLPTTGSIIGSTDLRNGSKQHPGGPAQLTIFYAGSVNVFDDVSPEKAQAIMLLAGNGASVAHHKTAPATEAPLPLKKRAVDEVSNGNRTQSSAFLSFPGAVTVSSQVSSRAVSPPQVKHNCNLELATVKSVRPLESPAVAQQESPKVIHSLRPPSTPLFSTGALPQARKASLARFLEKRKERVTITSPYPVSSKSPESSISKGSDN